MKRLFLILALLLLVGCATQTEMRPSEKTMKTTYIESLDKAIADSKFATEAKQNKGYKTILETNIKKAKTNEYVVFGILINNLQAKDDNFLVTVEFWEALDNMNSKIEVDENIAKSWLQGTDLTPFYLKEGESKFIPVIIKIGDEVKPGIKTTKGSYKFVVKSYYNVQGLIKKEYDSSKTLFLNIEP